MFALGFVLIFDLNRHIPWRFPLEFHWEWEPLTRVFSFRCLPRPLCCAFQLVLPCFFVYNCFLTSYHSKQDFYIVVLMLFYITEDLLYCSLFTGIIWEFAAVNLFFYFFSGVRFLLFFIVLFSFILTFLPDLISGIVIVFLEKKIKELNVQFTYDKIGIILFK